MILSLVFKFDLFIAYALSRMCIYCQVMYLRHAVLLKYSDFRITGADLEIENSPQYHISMVNLFYHLISHRSAKAPINHATEA